MKRMIHKKNVMAARAGRQREVYVSQEYVPDYGWEDVTVYDDTSSESLKLAKQDVRDYRENGYSARVITRRVNNPDYVEPENGLTFESADEWIQSECQYESENKSYYNDSRNYFMYLPVSPHINGGKGAFAQVYILSDGTVQVRNADMNRTKTVRSIDELSKELDRIANQYIKNHPSLVIL